MNGRNDKSKLIRLLLAGFDFCKVKAYMDKVGWKWFDEDTETRAIPTVGKLYQEAERLLGDAYDGRHTIGSGGFFASFDGVNLELSFCIEDNSVCMDDLK